MIYLLFTLLHLYYFSLYPKYSINTITNFGRMTLEFSSTIFWLFYSIIIIRKVLKKWNWILPRMLCFSGWRSGLFLLRWRGIRKILFHLGEWVTTLSQERGRINLIAIIVSEGGHSLLNKIKLSLLPTFVQTNQSNY